MKKTTAPRKTPSPAPREAQPHAAVGKTDSPSSVFMSLALDMSWRLAVVVLVPIIGGFELDQRLETTPALTIVGFLLAMCGMAIVLWQMMRTVSELPIPSKKGKH